MYSYIKKQKELGWNPYYDCAESVVAVADAPRDVVRISVSVHFGAFAAVYVDDVAIGALAAVYVDDVATALLLQFMLMMLL